MRKRMLGATALCAGALTMSVGSAVADPDITLLFIGEGSFSEYEDYGPANGIAAFAIATTSCNRGTTPADWYDTGSQAADHPVIAQQLYRYDNGRMEMIGMSWLKHGFCAVNEPGCGSCQSTSCDTLGVGCADTYWASLNASGLGPRSEVNASNGVFPYPFGLNPTGNSSIRGRLQAKQTDIYSGAAYYMEGMYVSAHDASVGNDNNNASYRRVNINPSSYAVSDFSGAGTVEGDPAVFAWRDVHNADVVIETIDIAGDGRIHVAYRVTDNGDGTWHYEYAIHNYNSHRSVGSFSVPVDAAVDVTNIGYHDVDHHSGEPFSGADWPGVETSATVEWATEDYSTNVNANAIRWGTMFNFRFDADQPPVDGDATIGLFRPGAPDDVTVSIKVPMTPTPTGCPGDADGNNIVDFDDLNLVLSNWATAGPDGDVSPFPGGDGAVDFDDLNAVLSEWGNACP